MNTLYKYILDLALKEQEEEEDAEAPCAHTRWDTIYLYRQLVADMGRYMSTTPGEQDQLNNEYHNVLHVCLTYLAITEQDGKGEQ